MTMHKSIDRRAFLRTSFRWLLVVSTLSGIGALITKKSDKCISNGICRGCGAFNGCGHPQALSAKAALPRK